MAVATGIRHRQGGCTMRDDRRVGLVSVCLFLVMALALASVPARAASLEELVSAVVRVKTFINPDGRTVESLGREREGSGIVIDEDGLVLTIGYLMVEAHAAWRSGIVAADLPLALRCDSATDPALAPPGAATLAVTIGCVPHALFDGVWTHEKRATLIARTLVAIEHADARSFFQKALGRRRADPARAAGDQDALVL